MNTLIHMEVFALNPKCSTTKVGRLPTCDGEEVKEGLMKYFVKIFLIEELSVLGTQWLVIPNLCVPTFN